MPQEYRFTSSLPKLQLHQACEKVKFQPDVSPYRSETLVAAEKKLLMSQASYTTRKTFCGKYVHKHRNTEETPRVPRASLLPALQKPLKKAKRGKKKSHFIQADEVTRATEEVKQAMLEADQNHNMGAVERKNFEMPKVMPTSKPNNLLDYQLAYGTPEPLGDQRIHTPGSMAKTKFKLPALTASITGTQSVDIPRHIDKKDQSPLSTTRSDINGGRNEGLKLPTIPPQQRFTQGIRFDMTWSKLEKRFRRKE